MTVTTRDIISSNDCLLPRQPERRGVGAEVAARQPIASSFERAFGLVQDPVDMGRPQSELSCSTERSASGSLPECGEHKGGDDHELYNKNKAL